MEEKDFNELISRVKESVKDVVKTETEEAVKGVVSTEVFEQKLADLGLEEDSIKNLTEAVEKQGEELRKFFEEGEKNGKSVEQMIHEKKDDIKKLASGEARNFKMHLSKKTLVQRTAVAGTTMAMRLPGVGEIPYQSTIISGLFRHAGVSPSSNGIIRYMDQENIVRNADSVAEGAQKPESEINWIEKTLSLEKIADSIPVTMEAFKDVSFIESEVRRLLDVNLDLKEDQLLWSGTGVAPQIKGVFTSALLFDPAAYAASPGAVTTQDATIYDLLAVLRVEIVNGKQSKYMPTAVVMNPRDILRYKLAKATDGHYVLPPFIAANGAVIDGMRVAESSQVTPNTLLIGDFRYGTIYDLDGVTVEMGWVNDQFIKNQMTILAEKREGLLIREVDVDAFLKVDDIDAAVNAVTTP